jgi:translation initiation factor IF-2
VAPCPAKRLVEENSVDLKYYSVIYDAIDAVKNAVSGLLAPEVKEEIIGLVEVKEVFRSHKLGDIADCIVVDGVVRRRAPIRVLQDNVVVFEGELESLRRFKDDVNEVKTGLECGIGVKNYTNSGDQIEASNGSRSRASTAAVEAPCRINPVVTRCEYIPVRSTAAPADGHYRTLSGMGHGQRIS